VCNWYSQFVDNYADTIASLTNLLYGDNYIGSRLKSRKNFVKTTISLTQIPETTRIDLWKKEMKGYNSHLWKYPKESLPLGSNLPWLTWKSINKLRTETTRIASNMKKRKIKEDGKCDCGQEQDADHLCVHYYRLNAGRMILLRPLTSQTKQHWLVSIGRRKKYEDTAIKIAVYRQTKSVWRSTRKEEGSRNFWTRKNWQSWIEPGSRIRLTEQEGAIISMSPWRCPLGAWLESRTWRGIQQPPAYRV